jgi:general secretion pathway protein K
VLWLTILLTVIASGFAYSMRTEALAARNAIALAQARAVADGAIARMSFELMRPRLAVGETWAADGAVHYWNDGGTSIAGNVVDLVDAIDDWKTAGDVKRPNGAKAPDYKAAGLSYGPANAPFETVADLQRVLGMTPALYAAVADSLTIYSRQAGVNPAYASRTVLLAFPNATPDVVDAYIAQRNDALNNRQPVPPFALANTGAAPVNVWRIRAEATTPDDATFVRDAVIRQGGDALHPVTVLLWQEGDRRLFAPPPPPPQ